MLPINDILLFVEVVKQKSFTIVAEKLDKTPAAISKRISQLETALGAKLLKRTTRSISPTEAGQLLFDNCQNLQLDLTNIIEKVSDTHVEPKGKIKISSMPNVTNLVLAPVINKFIEKYSKIEFDIKFDTNLSALPPISEYDIAFRYGKLEDSSAISRQLFAHDYIVCASPEYLRRNGTPKDLVDLKNHNCIDCRHGFTDKENTWTFYDDNQEHNVPVKGNMGIDNALLGKHLALNHIALVYSPSFIIAEEINNGLLVPVLTQYKTRMIPIIIVHPYTDRVVPKRVKLFIDFLYENIIVPSVSTRRLLKVIK